jgi:hypothetical protein
VIEWLSVAFCSVGEAQVTEGISGTKRLESACSHPLALRAAGRARALHPTSTDIAAAGRESNTRLPPHDEFQEEQPVAFRTVAFPLLSGGALLFGYAVFSWLRAKRGAQESVGPTTLREAGLQEPMLELDLDFEHELPEERGASLHDPVAPEDIGALFLARATDALSPFGEHAERDHEAGSEPREAVESAPESERRPSNAARAGARS